MRSTKDLENWRQIYPVGNGDPNVWDFWDMLRKRSMAALDTVNTMPMVFDPARNAGLTTDQLRDVIFGGSPGPGGTGGLNSQVTSLLEQIKQQLPTLSGIFAGGGSSSTTMPSGGVSQAGNPFTFVPGTGFVMQPNSADPNGSQLFTTPRPPDDQIALLTRLAVNEPWLMSPNDRLQLGLLTAPPASAPTSGGRGG